MTLPTPEQLHAETRRRWRLAAPDVAGDVDEATWARIREEVLCEWTDAAFDTFFPTAGSLTDDDTVLVEYWTDIKMQIGGGCGRWSWDNPPDPAP